MVQNILIMFTLANILQNRLLQFEETKYQWNLELGHFFVYWINYDLWTHVLFQLRQWMSDMSNPEKLDTRSQLYIQVAGNI